MSIRPGPWSNGRKLLDLISLVFVDQEDVCMLMHCLPRQEMARDALGEESILVDVVL